jgi:hypothetical protein
MPAKWMAKKPNYWPLSRSSPAGLSCKAAFKKHLDKP